MMQVPIEHIVAAVEMYCTDDNMIDLNTRSLVASMAEQIIKDYTVEKEVCFLMSAYRVSETTYYSLSLRLSNVIWLAQQITKMYVMTHQVSIADLFHPMVFIFSQDSSVVYDDKWRVFNMFVLAMEVGG